MPSRDGDNCLRRVLYDAAVLVLVASSLGIVTNMLRGSAFPVLAKKNYDIMVPCPEPSGSAEAILPSDPRINDPSSLVIDARSQEDYEAWHLPMALNIPFDWLAEQEQIDNKARIVARDVARSGKRAVILYGDGADPDSGRQWAALLNLAGIRNVTYIAGGSMALGASVAQSERP